MYVPVIHADNRTGSESDRLPDNGAGHSEWSCEAEGGTDLLMSCKVLNLSQAFSRFQQIDDCALPDQPGV